MQEILNTEIALNIAIISSLFTFILGMLIGVIIAKPTIINQKS